MCVVNCLVKNIALYLNDSDEKKLMKTCRKDQILPKLIRIFFCGENGDLRLLKIIHYSPHAVSQERIAS